MRTNHEPRDGTGAWPPIGRISDPLILHSSDLDQQIGIKAILTPERADNCSCYAARPAAATKPGADIDGATQTLIDKLNTAEVKLGITPQCETNGMLCRRAEL